MSVTLIYTAFYDFDQQKRRAFCSFDKNVKEQKRFFNIDFEEKCYF